MRTLHLFNNGSPIRTRAFIQVPHWGKLNTFKWQLQVHVERHAPTAVTYYFSVITAIKIIIFIKRNLKWDKKLNPLQFNGRYLSSIRCHSQWSACIRNWSVNSKEAQNICYTLASSSLSQYHLKMTNTSSSTSASVSRRNDADDAYDGTQGEGMALCSALTLTFILVIVGNLLTIIILRRTKIFARNICF